MPINVSGADFIVGVALGVLVGWVSLWSFLNPWVGKVIARIFALGAIGFGANWIVTPLVDYSRGETHASYYSPLGQGSFGPAIGWGVGGLVFGGAALALSFVRMTPRSQPPQELQKGVP
jgi:hypothetical protein